MVPLSPQPPQPVTAEEGLREPAEAWQGLDADGRRLLLAHARAVVEVTGRPRRVAPWIFGDAWIKTKVCRDPLQWPRL